MFIHLKFHVISWTNWNINITNKSSAKYKTIKLKVQTIKFTVRDNTISLKLLSRGCLRTFHKSLDTSKQSRVSIDEGNPPKEHLISLIPSRWRYIQSFFNHLSSPCICLNLKRIDGNRWKRGKWNLCQSKQCFESNFAIRF